MSCKEKKIDTMGGQAVIEGVLMRSPYGYAVAVRKQNGDIKVKKVPYTPITKKIKALGLPFMRGGVSLFEMLIIGMKALDFSANEWEEPEQTKKDSKKQNDQPQSDPVVNADCCTEKNSPIISSDTSSGTGEKDSSTNNNKPADERSISVFQMTLMILFSFGLAMVLGVVIPNLVTSYLGRIPGIENFVGAASGAADTPGALAASEKSHLVEEQKPFIYNLIAGTIRAIILFGYVVLIAQMKDIKRIFQYHGAEHKAVYAFEKEGQATIDNSRKYTTLHPRCGTSFLAIVIFISIIVFAMIAWLVITLFPTFTTLNFAIKKAILISLHILFAPIVAGISYEVLRFGAKHSGNKIFRILLMPGLMFQKITTKEPDDKQLEVAIASMNEALSINPDDTEAGMRIIPANKTCCAG